jgi:hypothetical protein
VHGQDGDCLAIFFRGSPDLGYSLGSEDLRGLLAVLPWAFFWGEAPEYRQWVRLGRP